MDTLQALQTEHIESQLADLSGPDRKDLLEEKIELNTMALEVGDLTRSDRRALRTELAICRDMLANG